MSCASVKLAETTSTVASSNVLSINATLILRTLAVGSAVPLTTLSIPRVPRCAEIDDYQLRLRATEIEKLCAQCCPVSVALLHLDVGKVVHNRRNAISSPDIKSPDRHFTRAVRGD